ncbi:MAG: GTP-binding protein [Gammaproteobacteria bacterium]|nr:MAG: GTP-binding protein [Gammaproteobacteria bacterium]
MPPYLPFRLLLAAGTLLGILLFLFLLLLVTDIALSVWERLQALPPWVTWAYLALLATLGGLGGLIVWRLLVPRTSPKPPPLPDEQEVRAQMERAEAQGIPVHDVRRELETLAQRRAAGTFFVALFGEISSGKSSLIKALLPEAEVAIDPRGGTTRTIAHYTWTSPAGDRLVLTDLPGLNEAQGELDTLAKEEALRAHLVIYVCEGDLTRDEYHVLQGLLELEKPLIVAFNKTDRYSEAEIEAILGRIRGYLGERKVDVVPVASGGMEEIIRVHPDGREERVTRARPPKVDALRELIQRHIDENPEALERLRDASVFVLAAQKLEAKVAAHRHAKAEELTRQYAGRAVFGAMAAVAPGMDVLIQGYLGMQLVRSLCDLYEVNVKEISIRHFLEHASSRVGKTLPLMMAVAGNAFKAFPGMGTLAGGMLHAVAYGLIFDSLGRAVVRTLESRGRFAEAPALRFLEDELHEGLEARAQSLAKIALEAKKNPPRQTG